MKRRWLALAVPLLCLAATPLLAMHWRKLDIPHLGLWAFPWIYGAAVMTAIPCMPLALGAGSYFGAGPGLVVVFAGEILGSIGCYVAGRWLGGESVRTWVGEHPRLSWLEPLLAREGGLIIGMAHLVPFLPFNLINYACGLMRVPFGSFLFWSTVGVFPWTAIQVLGADMVTDLVKGGPVSPSVAAFAVAILVTIAVLGLLARRRLQRQ